MGFIIKVRCPKCGAISELYFERSLFGVCPNCRYEVWFDPAEEEETEEEVGEEKAEELPLLGRVLRRVLG